MSAHTPLAALELLSGEMFDRWDSDQRAGKILIALSGHLPRYKPEVDQVRLACAMFPVLLARLNEAVAIVDDQLDGDFPEFLQAARAAILKAEGDGEARATPPAEPQGEEA